MVGFEPALLVSSRQSYTDRKALAKGTHKEEANFGLVAVSTSKVPL